MNLSDEYAVRTEKLRKVFREKTAVDGIDLEIRAGELFALLGVNGAGKTTTIRMLSGLISPTSGSAFIFGHSVTDDIRSVKPLINVSPQETAVAENLTVRENLKMIAAIYGAAASEAGRKADEIIGRPKLGEYSSTAAKKLSGGWKRRLSIAMALISSPKLLFLDEPTLGLDVLARRELWKLIESLKGTITVILTTHYLEEAEALSDRIGVMANGRLMKCGTAEELKADTGCGTLEEAFVRIAGGEIDA